MSAAPPPSPARVPVATYRLQLGPDLGFDAVAELLPYLDALGVSDCYTSPFFATSAPGSHGYDVADHNRLRDELGGEPAFRRFAAALAEHGMGLLVDVVPNHMGIAGDRNAWWRDVLENGESSRYAPFFDIDWRPVKRELADKVLLPILGAQYGAALDAGQLRLELVEGAFRVRYYETTLPLAPRTYARILGHGIERLQDALGADHPALLELKSLITWFVTIPARTETDVDRLAARERETARGKQRLAALLEREPAVRRFVEETIRALNGTPGDPHSVDTLDALLDEQAYRLAFWRVAGEEINYRRFFDINDLAAIRMEDAAVFEATHRLLIRLVGEGVVTGLRVDHPDGLYAPAEYFDRLQRACATARGDAAAPFYVVAEKILAPGEPLPARWAVAGTTGYEFLNLLNGIFVDRTQARAMDALYARLVPGGPAFGEIVYEAKRLIMETSMSAELAVLGHRLNIISERHRASRDFTLGSLTHALREIIACFPVYRTYVGDGATEPTDAEREYIGRAVTQARRRTPLMDASIYEWIQDLLLARWPAWADEAERRDRRDWMMRFQQTTGPVTAKGYEDTALYRYHRLVSLNEVGGDPSRYGTPLAEFHAAMAERARTTPHGLSATSTHDTKRSEDVRARINVLSEIPAEWRRHVVRWQRLNRRHRVTVDGQPVPGANEEYLLYQTLVGAWPISAERLGAYVLKAIHEAKVATSWMNPHPRYDEAMVAFAERVLDGRRSREFLRDFSAFQARVAHFGAFNALAQLLVKIAAPGVPDFYQGTEVWDLSLVDPDNRRPVDFAARRRLLDALLADVAAAQDLPAFVRELVKLKDDGRVKLFVMRQALVFRRRHAALFQRGDYRPLDVVGPLAEHACAFARVVEGEAAVAVVPRLLARRGIEAPPLGPEYWGGDTRVVVPADLPRRATNVLTGETLVADAGGLRLADVFASSPVALLAAAA
jgi:(1->4)-alpha-D-glucan 1-alpha-D-glucosylmutase